VLDYRARLDGVRGPDVVAAVLADVGELEEALPKGMKDAR
jgi:hypothetical protein